MGRQPWHRCICSGLQQKPHSHIHTTMPRTHTSHVRDLHSCRFKDFGMRTFPALQSRESGLLYSCPHVFWLCWFKPSLPAGPAPVDDHDRFFLALEFRITWLSVEAAAEEPYDEMWPHHLAIWLSLGNRSRHLYLWSCGTVGSCPDQLQLSSEATTATNTRHYPSPELCKITQDM